MNKRFPSAPINLALPAILSFVFVLMMVVNVTAQQVTPYNIPIPQTGWVVDTTQKLAPETIEYLNRVGDEVHDLMKREMVVVVIDTTSGVPHRKFGTNLFNNWGTGAKGQFFFPEVWKNNGLLLLVALEDRRVEIILGDGIDNKEYERICGQIVDDVVLPRFREGDRDSAIYEGFRACATRIYSITDLEAPVLLPSVSGNEAKPRGPRRKRRGPVTWWPFLAGGGALGAVGLVIGGRYYLRYNPIACEKCQLDMVLLEEDQDDQFLNEAQQLEEHLGSVDYDVWACLECEEIVTRRYGSWFTRYSHCPQCDYVTVHKIERTLVTANYHRGGKVRVTEDCKHCSFNRQYIYRTPKRVKVKTTSSGGGSGGGFRSGGGGFSSGGGGGRSFGGGSSSGGGAGGGW